MCERTPLTSARAIDPACCCWAGLSRAWRDPLGVDRLFIDGDSRSRTADRSTACRQARQPARLGQLAVAMLVLLARPAGAWRIAADHRRVAVDRHRPPAGRSGRGIASGGRLDRIAPGRRVDIGGVVVARERVDMLGDEVGQRRRRRLLELDVARASARGSLPRGSRSAAARTAGRPPAYTRRSASSGHSCAGG